MNTKSTDSTSSDARDRFLARFEPHGLAGKDGWGCLGTLILIGSGLLAVNGLYDVVANGLSEVGASVWVFLPLGPMILLGALMTKYDVWTQLDVDGGAIVENRILHSQVSSRRHPVDLSQVREVSLIEKRKVKLDNASQEIWLDHAAVLVGSSPEYVYRAQSDSQVQLAGEYFAVALGVPLRLDNGDVRTPSEISEPLRDRLARRSLPATTSPEWYEDNTVTIEEDVAAGTTTFVIPNVAGVGGAIRAAIGFSVIVMGLLMLMLGLGHGLVTGSVVAVLALLWAWNHGHESTKVTVLPDGGLELVERRPFGDNIERIAGDNLDEVGVLNVSVVARGWPEAILFGAGLSSDELERFAHELRRAIAERSGRSSGSGTRTRAEPEPEVGLGSACAATAPAG